MAVTWRLYKHRDNGDVVEGPAAAEPGYLRRGYEPFVFPEKTPPVEPAGASPGEGEKQRPPAATQKKES